MFGKAGRWIADISGMLLLLLAISGIVIWAQRARARRRHR
ncbi:MAG: PepSY domain-containing protein [Proteobacteria bacterium]|nr:PepSY domain-containing protein [Pseudomonadota bacterium]